MKVELADLRKDLNAIGAAKDKAVSDLATASANLATANAEIERLKAENATLASASARVTELETANATLTAEKAAAVKEAETAKTAQATAEKALEDLKASPSAQAQQILASMGVPAAKLPKASANASKPESMTMAAFNALPPAARMAHIKAGGKLTD